MLTQWFLNIRSYAEEMLDGLHNRLPKWPQTVKEAQLGWIGRSQGARIRFKVVGGEYSKEIEIFTTRPDTIFGVTYLAVSPENTELLDRLCYDSMAARNQVHNYKEKLAKNPSSKTVDLDDMEPG